MQETEKDSEFHLIVTSVRRDGRRRYGKDSKLALVLACLQPGVSLAGMALKHGVNANLLRKWVSHYKLSSTTTVQAMPIVDPMNAFVPVLLGKSCAGRVAQSQPMSIDPAATPSPMTISPARLRAQMPNGTTLEFECDGHGAVLLATVIETLGRCDVSAGR